MARIVILPVCMALAPVPTNTNNNSYGDATLTGGVQPKTTDQPRDVRDAAPTTAIAGAPPTDFTSSGTPAEVAEMQRHFVAQTNDVALTARGAMGQGDGGVRIGAMARVENQGVTSVGGGGGTAKG